MQHGQKKKKKKKINSSSISPLRQFSVFSLSQWWDVTGWSGPFLWSLYSLITGCGWAYSPGSGETRPECCVSLPGEAAASLPFLISATLITDFLGSECKSLKQNQCFKKAEYHLLLRFIPTKFPAPWLPWQSKRGLFLCCSSE